MSCKPIAIKLQHDNTKSHDTKQHPNDNQMLLSSSTDIMRIAKAYLSQMCQKELQVKIQSNGCINVEVPRFGVISISKLTQSFAHNKWQVRHHVSRSHRYTGYRLVNPYAKEEDQNMNRKGKYGPTHWRIILRSYHLRVGIVTTYATLVKSTVPVAKCTLS